MTDSNETELEKQRKAAIRQRAASQWAHKREPSGLLRGVAPTRADVDPALVHPMRDAQGRPRVRVLVLGALTEVNATANEFAAITGRAYSKSSVLASDKREYTFVLSRSWETQSSDDPSHPLIAMVYAPFARRSSPLDDGVALWSYAQIGYRAPLLWLLGIKAIKERDENVIRVREHVDACGFVADECPTLCAPTMTLAAVQTLVSSLDEHFDASELLLRESPALKIARGILQLVRDSAPNAITMPWNRFTSLVARALWGHTDESDAVLGEVCALFIDRGQCDHAAKLLSTSVLRDPQLFERWLERERERVTVNPSFEVLSAIYRYAAMDRESAIKHTRALIDAATYAPRIAVLRDRLRVIGGLE